MAIKSVCLFGVVVVELFNITVSVLKCTELCLCKRGKGVFTFGNIVRVVFI